MLSDLIIEFEATTSSNLKYYKMYYEESPNPVTYLSRSVVLGKKTTVVLNELNDISKLCGIYNLGIVAVDLANNESCMSRINDFPIIFDPPCAPGELLFRRKYRCPC